MVSILKSTERGKTKIDWLESYHSFSFGNYYNPNNMGFGPLRVINDDIVNPGAGFPTHPHKDMEIVTIVTQGAVAHQDSSGGNGIIRVGEVQKMSAGKGIYHSEFNASDKEILKLLQIWIIPNQTGLKPSYEEMQYSLEDKKNKLLLVASGNVNDAVIFINQDVKLYISDLEEGKQLTLPIPNNYGVYLHLIDGKLKVNNYILNSGDAIKITDEESLSIWGEQNSSFLLFVLGMNN